MRSVCPTLGMAGGQETTRRYRQHRNWWLAKPLTLQNALFFCNLLSRLNLDFSPIYVFRAVSERPLPHNAERVFGSKRLPVDPQPAPAGKFDDEHADMRVSLQVFPQRVLCVVFGGINGHCQRSPVAAGFQESCLAQNHGAPPPPPSIPATHPPPFLPPT